jgi:hypothetical protein
MGMEEYEMPESHSDQDKKELETTPKVPVPERSESESESISEYEMPDTDFKVPTVESSVPSVTDTVETASVQPLEKSEEEIKRENLEKEMEEENKFIDSIDDIAHSEQYQPEKVQIERLNEIKKAVAENAAEGLLKSKIYRQEIENLCADHARAIKEMAQKADGLGAEGYSLRERIGEKTNEIARQLTELKRHLFDIDQLLK